MAFLKTAVARVTNPNVSHRQWSRIRVASQNPTPSVDASLIDRAAEFLGQKFDPKDYLLTHCTIVSSVDTYSPSGVKTGSDKVDGVAINRKYSDFRITPETEVQINHNYDAFERGALLKSYKSFIGGHNFLEHTQIESLSKGRIIDAVARDIGDSVYIDILVATDRKHKDLVKSIENGKLTTLSMGANVAFTICTKCGNVSPDEPNLCTHIRYEKGNTFYDESGKPQRVAELCGHSSEEDGGVHFIEASWVEVPAFTGAVMRNVITPSSDVAKQAEKVLNTIPEQWQFDSSQVAKAATVKKESGWMDETEGDAETETPVPEQPASKEDDPLDSLTQELETTILEKVKERIRERIRNKKIDESSGESSMSPNNSVIKDAYLKKVYASSVSSILKKSSSDTDFVNSLAEFNTSVGISIPVNVYRASLELGPVDQYKSLARFRKACSEKLGYVPTIKELATLTRLAKLLVARRLSSGNNRGQQ
jgi:hypothetical protein